MLGLNTCWVALTYKKNKAKVIVNENEKLVCVLALGYGKTQGVQHKSKPLNKLSNLTNNSPVWFKNGVELVSLAPTAVNQQKFYFEQVGNQVLAKPGIGFHVKTDLGIAKYHFEIGAGINNFTWK